MGKTNSRQGLLSKVCLCRLDSGDKGCSLPDTGHLHREKCMLCLWAGGGGQRALPVSALSQLLSAQNYPYAQVAYFEVAHSDPLQEKRVGWEVFCNVRQSAWKGPCSRRAFE